MNTMLKQVGPLLCAGLTAFGLAQMAPQTASAQESIFECTFTSGANQTRSAPLSTPVEMRFGLEDETGQAVEFRNGERVTVLVVRGIDGLSFVEAKSTGVVNVTTITTDGNSVHSRHDIRGGSDVAAIQYYGECPSN